MLRISVIIVVSILTLSNVLAQKVIYEPKLINPLWSVGAQKTITTIDSVTVYSGDTLFMASGAKSKFRIKIVTSKDTVFEVLFKQLDFDAKIDYESEVLNLEPAEILVQKFSQEIQKELKGLKYKFLVNRNTAQAFEIKNIEVLLNEIGKFFESSLNRLIKVSGAEFSEDERSAIESKTKIYLQENIPGIMQNMLNSFNYIFQPYKTPFVIGRTYRDTIEISDLDFLKFGDKSVSAYRTVRCKVQNMDLRMDYSNRYDEEKMSNFISESEGYDSQITKDDFEIKESGSAIFDMKSSWLSESTFSLKYKMGGVQFVNSRYVEIR